MSDGQKHMQHTAGPWRRQRPHGSDIPVWGADGKSRGCVALVNMSAERAAEAEANAVLIAAAPTMYEALKALVESLDWESKRSGTTYAGHEDARAAIAKAEGRT